MSKRIFIIHRWDGSPTSDWNPWLKEKLEAEGFEIHVPAMPETANPRIETWVPALAKAVEEADTQTYFIGHSIACQAILRYLEQLPLEKKIGGVVFVAPWLVLKGLEGEEEKAIVKPWLETPIDFQKVQLHTQNFLAVFSDNDPFVPLENESQFAEKLGAKTIVEKGKGHFTESGDVASVLEEILKVLN